MEGRGRVERLTARVYVYVGVRMRPCMYASVCVFFLCSVRVFV